MSEPILLDSKVPSMWTTTSLAEVCAKITDGTHKTPKYQASGVRFISIKNIRPFQAVSWLAYEKYISAEEHAALIKRCHPEKGDILFPRIGTLGFAKRIDFDEEVSIFVGLGLLKPDRDLVTPKYLEYWMNSPLVARLSTQHATGTGRLTLPLEATRRFPIPLPPLAEQKRIVAKIEELFSELDAGEESLRQARRQLGVYRQSLLKQAFEGKLTAPWRAQNPDLVESPDELLASIHAERAENWIGKGTCSRAKAPKLDDESQLPSEWVYASVDQLTLNFDGQRVPLKRAVRDKRSGEYPYYGASGIIDDIDDYLFDGRYLLIAEDGANLLSRSKDIAFQAHGKFWVNNHAHIVQTLAGIPLRYLELFLNGKDLTRFVTGSAQPKITQANLNQVPVPLCSLSEQQEIVRLLDEQFEVIEQNEREIAAALKRSEALRQSILKKAFTGQLVPQDPTDEPASTLLARIRSARETAANPKKKAAKKQTARKRGQQA